MTPIDIRNLRKSLRLSTNAFAEALGFAGKNRSITVHRWECGMRTPSPQCLKLMQMMRKPVEVVLSPEPKATILPNCICPSRDKTAGLSLDSKYYFRNIINRRKG